MHVPVIVVEGIEDGTPYVTINIGCMCGEKLAEHKLDARDHKDSNEIVLVGEEDIKLFEAHIINKTRQN